MRCARCQAIADVCQVELRFPIVDVVEINHGHLLVHLSRIALGDARHLPGRDLIRVPCDCLRAD